MDSIVYALHEPVRIDRHSRRMVKLDISSATAFGELRVLMPGADRPPPVEDCVKMIREGFAAFRPCDYILLAGDLDLIVYAALVASKASGAAPNLLKWHSKDRMYFKVEAPEGLLS